MSSRERPRAIWPLQAAFLIAALTAVAGCTVRPLYSDAGYSGSGVSAVTGSIGAELSTISVKPVTTRVGQEVRNHLIFLFNGGEGEPVAPRYALELAVAWGSEATANIQVNKQNEPTAAILTAWGTYRLLDSTGKMVAKGSRQFTASYDVPRQEFAAVRAQRDAENRAARELAELIRMDVAQHLERNPAPAEQTAQSKPE